MRLIPFYPSLIITYKGKKILVIADLHIGWEAQLLPQGIHLPSQVERMVRKLREIIHISNPDSMIVLGDVKNTVQKIKDSEWREIPFFFEEALKWIDDIKVVPGNHDGNLAPLIPSSVEILPTTGTHFGDIGFIHGHAWFSSSLLKCKNLIMGHMHPIIHFNSPIGVRSTKQVWVEMNCNPIKIANSYLKHENIKVSLNETSKILLKKYSIPPKISKIIVMPSFNDLIGGFNIKSLNENFKSEYIGPIFRSEATDLTRSEIFFLDGTFIGTLKDLNKY